MRLEVYSKNIKENNRSENKIGGSWLVKKVGKIVLIVVAVILCVLIYELAGAAIGYHHQPKVSEETRKKFDLEKYMEKESVTEERAAVIEDNLDALIQRVRLIENAKEEVILSTYAFHSDRSGKIMIGTLLEAADRGVKVKILADGLESYISMEGNPFFFALSSHENIEIKLYNKVNFLKPWNSMGRMHDKYVIADGKAYLLGGRNTYDFFLGGFEGHTNYDRDILVYCEEPKEGSSVHQLKSYFEAVWNYPESKFFQEKESLKKKNSVKEAKEEALGCYNQFKEEHKDIILDTDLKKDTFKAEQIQLIVNPITRRAKEPVAFYQLGEIMKSADERVNIHTPYIIFNEMMYETIYDISKNVADFRVMTNSVANNGNVFGSADYEKNREKILKTGIDIWEYEGGVSYHGKSILIDDDISIIGSFNMDMRSAYLDTELMLFVRCKEVNEQLEKRMNYYESGSRQILEDGSYYNPNDVDPVELGTGKKVKNFLVQYLLGWMRYLF